MWRWSAARTGRGPTPARWSGASSRSTSRASAACGWTAARRRSGPATFFSSANGAVARWAWERVPFRPVPYAEDQPLARDMLAAGLAKAYVPEAAVVHSHDLPPLRALRRYFDDFRALREVHGLREPLTPRSSRRGCAATSRADRAFMRREGLEVQTWRSLKHHVASALGRSLGTNADRLPAWAPAALARRPRDVRGPLGAQLLRRSSRPPQTATARCTGGIMRR